jgi:inner membrane protein
MDSLTQVVLGSTVAALAVPAQHRRKALVAGAVLGTLPDLDSIPISLLSNDPVAHMVMHRGASHSLLVLPLVGLVIWYLLRRYWTPVREAPGAWLAAILLALVTHPLLDAFTVYGTQLLWPLPPSPVMWSSLWIIDPLYTLPLLAGVLVAAVWGPSVSARRWLWVGVMLSSAYLLWSLIGKVMVERQADIALQPLGLREAPRFSVPMPLNTLLWQVIVMTPQGYLVGEHSLIADRKPMQFRSYPSDTAALESARQTVPALQRLLWFNHGFMKASVDPEGRLVVADLRMGQEPDYVFQFAVARRQRDTWEAILPEQVPTNMQIKEQLPAIWARIFREP